MPKIKTTCTICGKEIYRWPYSLRQHKPVCSRKCFAESMTGKVSATRADLVGQRFDKLTVVEFVGIKKGHALWRCICDCGNETFVTTGLLQYGATRSCGCLTKRRGADHPNWKQGFHIRRDGYKEIPIENSTDHHRYQAEHRVIAEKVLGRKLKPDEVIHHINQDKMDNRPENLQVMTRAEHASLHADLRRMEDEA